MVSPLNRLEPFRLLVVPTSVDYGWLSIQAFYPLTAHLKPGQPRIGPDWRG